MQAELREATMKFEEVVKEARGALDGLSEKEGEEAPRVSAH